MNDFFVQNAFITVVMIVAAGAMMLLARSWRFRIAGLAIQYIAAFWLVSLSWPVGLAVIKLVVGWMAAAIIGLSGVNFQSRRARRWPTEWLFWGLALLLVILSVSTLAPRLQTSFPRGYPAQIWGSLLLIGIGLLNLGVSSLGLRVIVSLLTVLSGFEILYAVVERSTLVAGLLAVVTLGNALAGSYLLDNTPSEVEV